MSNQEILNFLKEAIDLKINEGNYTRAEQNTILMFYDCIENYVSSIEAITSPWNAHDLLDFICENRRKCGGCD